MKRANNAEGLSGNSLVTCVLSAGVFKSNLPKEERQTLKKLLEPQFPGSDCLMMERGNGLLFYLPVAGDWEEIQPMKTGGACVISWGDKLAVEPTATMKQLNGSWAAVMVDGGRIFLGRDQAGAQSMYYAVIGSALYFASSLTLLRGLLFTVDLDAISDFLHFLYVPAPRTIYKEVKSILPGQCVSYDGKTLTEIDLAWGAPQEPGYNLKEIFNEELYVSSYEQILVKSVRSACSAQGKTALFLSGGKDSSALAIALNLGEVKNVEAVTLGFEEQELDETEDAGTVAQHLGIPFRPLKIPRRQYLQYWPEFVCSLGQPVGDFAALPVFAAVKELGDTIDIFLDGTGNDRYFGITTSWQEDMAWHLNRLVPGLHHLPWHVIAKGWSYTVDFLGRTLTKPREEQFVSWNGWTGEEIERLTGSRPDWHKGRLYDIYNDCFSPMAHKTMTLCGIWEPEAAYRKVVQIVNAVGKSVRYPFLDHHLVCFCRNLPESWKYSGRTNKVVLRELLKKYLPRKILTKKKGVFNFPKAYILTTNNYEMIGRFLSTECIRKHGWIDPNLVAGYIREYKNGNTTLEDRLWSIVMLHSWAELRCH